MMAIITADELAHDLPGAEAMMTRYKEHRAEVDSRKEAFNKFRQTGQAFISQGHFLSDEVCPYVFHTFSIFCFLLLC